MLQLMVALNKSPKHAAAISSDAILCKTRRPLLLQWQRAAAAV
jgi:hypothetical protein